MDFVKQYNAAGGLMAIAPFKSKNCCISLASGKMVTIKGSPYKYQFPASEGGITCNPDTGYSKKAYTFYRNTKMSMATEFGEMDACIQEQNPAIWIKSVSTYTVKPLAKRAPTADEIFRKKSRKAGHLCIDCKTTAWTAWGECSKLCSGGVHKRFRVVSNVPNLCGKVCPTNLEDAKSCHNEKCIKANINDVTPGMFFNLKILNVEPKVAISKSKRYSDVVTTLANWYPGWVKVESVHEADSSVCPVFKVGTHEYSLVKEADGELLKTNGKPTYRRGKAESWVKVKSDFLYFFESKKGSKMWLVGPTRGSADAHTLGQGAELKTAKWFTFAATKWNAASIKATCLPHHSSEVRFFVGAPTCGSMMESHMKNVRHMLKHGLVSMEKRLGLTAGTIHWEDDRMHNMACEPAIKLSVKQLATAKPVKTACAWKSGKLHMDYEVPKGHAHNCFHKLNPRTKQWDCMCNTWPVAP
jgi:hypothetical protein